MIENFEKFRGRFASHLGSGRYGNAWRELEENEPSPEQAKILLGVARHARSCLPKNGIPSIHRGMNDITQALMRLAEPRPRRSGGKARRLEEAFALVEVIERPKAEGRRKGKGTVAEGWEQKPQRPSGEEED